MVLKKSKFGGNSGNTLRRKPHGTFDQSFKRGLFITKSTKIDQNSHVVTKEWIDDFNLNKNLENHNSYNQTTDSVKFSLNKKKRWLLPDHLKYEFEEETKFQSANGMCTQKRKMTKTNRNKSVYARSRVVIIEKPNNRYFPTNQKYCSYFSDSQDKMAFRKSDNQRAKIEITPDIQDVVDVLYTIQKPFSSKVWPYHVDSSKKGKGTRCSEKPKRCVCMNRDDEFFDDYAENYEMHLDEDYELKASRPESLKLENFIRSKSVSFNNEKILQNSTSKQSYEQVNPASSFVVKKHPKGSSITIQHQMLKTIEDKSYTLMERSECDTSFVETESVYQEFQCLLSTKEITSNSLQDLFGNRYQEGGSDPRSFLIFNKEFSMNGTLAHFQLHSNIEDDTSLVSVQIFCPPYEKPVIGDEVMEMTHLTRLIFRENSEIVNSNNKIRGSFIHRKYQPKANVVNPDEIWYNAIKRYHPTTTICHQEASNVCPICLNNDIINMVCLKECGHNFCSDCFESFVNIKISAGTFTFSCLEFKCEIEIDYVTLLGYVDVKYLSMLNRKIVDLSVLKDRGLHFCPNDNCNKVALVTNEETAESEVKALSNNTMVACACFKNWCFGCRKDNHWPSSCAAYESYMIQKGKDVGVIFDGFGQLFQISVNFRICPFCRNPVQKNGGCDHMTCRCGKEFCWNCLKNYKDHDYNACRPMNDDHVLFTSLDDKSGAGKVVRLQRKAYAYSSTIRELSSLKRKLKIEKFLYAHKFLMDKEKSMFIVVKRCFDLLEDCYKLMENLTIARAFLKSRHLSGRIVSFAAGLQFNMNVLRQSLPLKEIKEVNLGTVLKNEEFVKNYLDKLKFLVS